MPKPKAAHVILGEAAGEGPNGMEMVRDIMYNRTKARKLNLEQVANEHKQFSAAARPDLAEFVQKQPPIYRTLADRLVEETASKDYKPKYTEQHYVTKKFYEDRHTLPKDHWVNNMDVSQAVGNHVLLIPRKKR